MHCATKNTESYTGRISRSEGIVLQNFCDGFSKVLYNFYRIVWAKNGLWHSAVKFIVLSFYMRDLDFKNQNLLYWEEKMFGTYNFNRIEK